jgi:hypothetical protein
MKKDFMKMAVFWVVATTQKTAVFVLTVMRTSNPIKDFMIGLYTHHYFKLFSIGPHI